MNSVGDSPKEMPCPEYRLAQRLGRIVAHEVQVPPYLQEILLRHALLREVPILLSMLPEVTAIQYLGQQQFPRFTSIGAIIAASGNPNVSCSTQITALANFQSPRHFNSRRKV